MPASVTELVTEITAAVVARQGQQGHMVPVTDITAAVSSEKPGQLQQVEGMGI